jgi:hypothetical protein
MVVLARHLFCLVVVVVAVASAAVQAFAARPRGAASLRESAPPARGMKPPVPHPLSPQPASTTRDSPRGVRGNWP